MKQVKAEIVYNREVAREHYLLSFKASSLRKKVNPGEFFDIRVKDSYEPLLRRPFSVHKVDKNKIDILYKVVGKATEALSAKKKGDFLDILGPLGNGFDINLIASARGGSALGGNRYPLNAILVGGGHGVAPLYELAKRLSVSACLPARQGCRLVVYIGARTKKYIVGEKVFKKLKAKVRIATEDGSKGHKGLITNLLNRHLKNSSAAHRVVYACGPKEMLEAVSRLAKRYKMPCQVSLEEYMACGIGTCLGCAVKTRSGYKLVCKDGPVFNAEDIVWQE